MKILIIGSNGQLGWELVRQSKGEEFETVAIDYPEIDVTNENSVAAHINQINPSMVLNASAYTAVDQAENDIETAFAVNKNGPWHLVTACYRSQIPIIHVSTDYVFDGSNDRPYKESDPINPLGIYGESKAAGEAKVHKGCRQHIIIRTSWLYGVWGNNFVKTMLKLGKERNEIRVVNDQYGCPTFAADLAETIFLIAKAISSGDNTNWGTYHYCGSGVTTWYQFAEKIFELARKYDEFEVKKIIPIPSSEYPTPSKRPAYSALDCSLIQKRFGIKPRNWSDSLSEMIRRLYS